MSKFAVTYAIVTNESAEQGEVAEQGFIDNNLTLREAVREVFRTRTNKVDGVECIEASSSRPESARWVSVVNGAEYETGDREERALHIPESVRRHSRARIVRLVKSGRYA